MLSYQAIMNKGFQENTKNQSIHKNPRKMLSRGHQQDLSFFFFLIKISITMSQRAILYQSKVNPLKINLKESYLINNISHIFLICKKVLCFVSRRGLSHQTNQREGFDTIEIFLNTFKSTSITSNFFILLSWMLYHQVMLWSTITSKKWSYFSLFYAGIIKFCWLI